jgi:hypothetical protein
MRPIHDRMLVILAGAQQTAWLASAAAATELLRSAPDEMLQLWPVSRQVNRAGNENEGNSLGLKILCQEFPDMDRLPRMRQIKANHQPASDTDPKVRTDP